MDRVVLGGCILLVVFGILLGTGMGSSEVMTNRVRGVFELLSFAGTAVTAVVAVVALSSWQAQFRHAERFKSIKELKDAATGLYTFRGYLLALVESGKQYRANGGVPNAQLEEIQLSAAERWRGSLEVYVKAWSTAVVFFTDEEEKSFSGQPRVFIDLTSSMPAEIINAGDMFQSSETDQEFLKYTTEITNHAQQVYSLAVSQLEYMLRSKG
ncbi:hypothetical protein [Pseudomonas sp. IT-P291]|uniref:hypothetical protein n=1 Tax=Pseudomonas sp. IT-P291 TaxID=3026448 RepID=UPI0039DF641C